MLEKRKIDFVRKPKSTFYYICFRKMTAVGKLLGEELQVLCCSVLLVVKWVKGSIFLMNWEGKLSRLEFSKSVKISMLLVTENSRSEILRPWLSFEYFLASFIYCCVAFKKKLIVIHLSCLKILYILECVKFVQL